MKLGLATQHATALTHRQYLPGLVEEGEEVDVTGFMQPDMRMYQRRVLSAGRYAVPLSKWVETRHENVHA